MRGGHDLMAALVVVFFCFVLFFLMAHGERRGD